MANNNNNDGFEWVTPIGHVDECGYYIIDDDDYKDKYNTAFDVSDKFDIEDKDVVNVVQREVLSSTVEFNTINNNFSKSLYSLLKNHPLVVEMEESTQDGVKYVGFKVDPSKCRSGDDKAYKEDNLLQQTLPRGIVFAVDENDEDRVSLVLFSNRKFFGEKHGDEDDGNEVTNLLEIVDGEYVNFDSFMVTGKANGSNGQVARANDRWIIGSKNRKVIVKTREDLKGYKQVRCYSFALRVAYCFFDLLDSVEADGRLEHFTTLMESTGWTLNFELEDVEDQHIEPLRETRLVLINVTGAHVFGGSCHPYVTNFLGKYFNIHSVVPNVNVYPSNRYQEVSDKVRSMWAKEGSVIVLFKNGRVIGLVKVKTDWYKILRAMREKLKFTNVNNCQEYLEKIASRLDTIQQDFSVEPQMVALFKRLAEPFCFWLLSDEDRMSTLRSQYALLWESFLKEFGLPLTSGLLITDTSHVKVDGFTVKREDLPLLVLLQKVPGTGGGYLCAKLIEKYGNSVGSFSQDDFQRPGVSKKQASQECFKAVRDALTSGEYDVVILDRNNTSSHQYSVYVDLDVKGLCRAVFLAPQELKGISELKKELYATKDVDSLHEKYSKVYEFLYTAVCSMLTRKQSNKDTLNASNNNNGSKKGKKRKGKSVNYIHPTDVLSDEKLCEVCLGFAGDLRFEGSCEYINFLNDTPLDVPQEFFQVVDAFVKSGFRCKRKLKPNDLKSLKFDQVNLHDHRSTETVDALFDFLQKKSNAYVPPYNSYLAVVLDEEAKQALFDNVSTALDKEFPDTWSLSCTHVTLQHSKGFKADEWDKALSLVGGRVKVQPETLYFHENKLCALEVTLFNDEMEDLSNLVTSGFPHVTVSLAPKVYAFTSLLVLKDPKDALVLNCSDFPSVNGTVRHVLQGEKL